MPSAKAVGVSGGFLGGGGLVGVGVREMLYMEPDATLLSSLGSNLNTKYSTDKYGNTDNNKDIFIDPDDNQSWWEWAYKRRFSVEKAKTSEFKAVTVAYSGSNDSSLNQVCKAALVKEKKKLVKVSYKEDIWKFCSQPGNIPDDIKARPTSTTLDTKDVNKFAQTDDNKKKFVDGNKSDNEEFWNWVYENRLKTVLDDSKKKEANLHSTFKAVTKGYDSSVNTALNKVCKTAGEKKPKELTNIKYKKNTWRYCSKDGRIPDGIDKPPTSYPLNHTKSKSQQVSGNEGEKLGNVSANKAKLISNVGDNEEWWNWTYENKLSVDKTDDAKKNNIHSEFKAVEKGYSTDTSKDNTKALNLVCKTTYEKGETDLKAEHYMTSIAAYCTIDGNTLASPKTSTSGK